MVKRQHKEQCHEEEAQATQYRSGRQSRVGLTVLCIFLFLLSTSEDALAQNETTQPYAEFQTHNRAPEASTTPSSLQDPVTTAETSSSQPSLVLNHQEETLPTLAATDGYPERVQTTEPPQAIHDSAKNLHNKTIQGTNNNNSFLQEENDLEVDVPITRSEDRRSATSTRPPSLPPSTTTNFLELSDAIESTPERDDPLTDIPVEIPETIFGEVTSTELPPLDQHLSSSSPEIPKNKQEDTLSTEFPPLDHDFISASPEILNNRLEEVTSTEAPPLDLHFSSASPEIPKKINEEVVEESDTISTIPEPTTASVTKHKWKTEPPTITALKLETAAATETERTEMPTILMTTMPSPTLRVRAPAEERKDLDLQENDIQENEVLDSEPNLPSKNGSDVVSPEIEMLELPQQDSGQKGELFMRFTNPFTRRQTEGGRVGPQTVDQVTRRSSFQNGNDNRSRPPGPISHALPRFSALRSPLEVVVPGDAQVREKRKREREDSPYGTAQPSTVETQDTRPVSSPPEITVEEMFNEDDLEGIAEKISKNASSLIENHVIFNQQRLTDKNLTTSHPKRVTVNVTISTEGEQTTNATSGGKPVYLLSVSVPTQGNGMSQTGDQSQQQPAQVLVSLLGNLSNPVHPPSTTSQATTNAEGKCQCDCPFKATGVVPEFVSEPEDYPGDYPDPGPIDLGYQSAPAYRPKPHVIYAYPNYQGPSKNKPGNQDQTTIKYSVHGKTKPVFTIPQPGPEYRTVQEQSAGTESSTEAQGKRVKCPEYCQKAPILFMEAESTSPVPGHAPDGSSFRSLVTSQLYHKFFPYSFWNLKWQQTESGFILFNFTISRGASLAVYGRKNALPSHTSHDFMQIIKGYTTEIRTPKAAVPHIRRNFTQYLEQGNWFLSIYNDGSHEQPIMFSASVALEMTANCPNGCNNHGRCVDGQCECEIGFNGIDCSQRTCPILCSGHGEYVKGECSCNPGWKGKECHVRYNECEVADCSGRGQCEDGECKCIRGYKGKFCQESDCADPTCSNHGYCVQGMCLCSKGWTGINCELVDDSIAPYLPVCNNHGVFNTASRICQCDSGWRGDDCSKRACDMDCGAHGHCEGRKCTCDEGWTGTLCDEKLCDIRCEEHGVCENGTCKCVQGWNGRHCSMEGCPNACGHGNCVQNYEREWTCSCELGWSGPGCSVKKESVCDDDVDNDGDHLTDCEDSECCLSPVCRHSHLCLNSIDPVEFLLRKQPPAPGSSFYQRIKFFIEEPILQRFARVEAFDSRRASLVRGQVLDHTNSGVYAVRISTDDLRQGFVLTRGDGWFDLVVNGGGAITINFGKHPFHFKHMIVNVPWNEIITIDPVILSLSEEVAPTYDAPEECLAHDYDVVRPVIMATWKQDCQGGCTHSSSVLAESQVVQEVIPIPETDVKLVYQSSRTEGYKSIIQLQLTPESIPQTLYLVHLLISVEGRTFKKVFEADVFLKYTYSWDRYNIYRQKVYGLTRALISVGYEYTNCKEVIWDSQKVLLRGHDLAISEVGGWNLDIHHKYDFNEGILQKGDGTTLSLSHTTKSLVTVMGTGYRRPEQCESGCAGVASSLPLLDPLALAASPDGSLFVGDYDIIRKIDVNGNVTTIARLNLTLSSRYYLGVHPRDGSLYVSMPANYQVIHFTFEEDGTVQKIPVAGNGERCLPGDRNECGDKNPAIDATLTYPKGIAISRYGDLWIADGNTVRRVGPDGIITTVIGSHKQRSQWKPPPCGRVLQRQQIQLKWPKQLSISPIDDSLYILDDTLIVRLTPDGRLQIIAGQTFNCPVQPSPSPPSSSSPDSAKESTLVSPQSMAFGPNGDLYLLESDSSSLNRVRLITPDGGISVIAGAEGTCKCDQTPCTCDEDTLAYSSTLGTLSAITVSPKGIPYFTDQTVYKVRAIEPNLPKLDLEKEFEIPSPFTKEVYVFNGFGHHVTTKNMLTGETLYSFEYSIKTSTGKLFSVTDSRSNKLSFIREYSWRVYAVETPRSHKCQIGMDEYGMLAKFTHPGGYYSVSLTYHGTTGLLATRLDSMGRLFRYDYDNSGRLANAYTPSGEVISFESDLSNLGKMVSVLHDSRKSSDLLISNSALTTKKGDSETVLKVASDGTSRRDLPWGESVILETSPQAILAQANPQLGGQFQMPTRQKTLMGQALINKVSWHYYTERFGRQKKTPLVKVSHSFVVNGVKLFSDQYDIPKKTQSLMYNGSALLTITYDERQRPYQWSATHGKVSLSYDRFGWVSGWQRGPRFVAYEYDQIGRLQSSTYSNKTKYVYTYHNDGPTVSKVVLPSDGIYQLHFDSTGGLEAIHTPVGTQYYFSISSYLGFSKLKLKTPAHVLPHTATFNSRGRILGITSPGGTKQVSFGYIDGLLQTVFAGNRKTIYKYKRNSGLLKSVSTGQPDYVHETEIDYSHGLVKEINYSIVINQEPRKALLKINYDEHARISEIDVKVDEMQFSPILLKNLALLGSPLAVNDFAFEYKDHFTVVITEGSRNFNKIQTNNEFGNIKTIHVLLRNRQVYELKVEYDVLGKVVYQEMIMSGRTRKTYYAYTVDGYLSAATGQRSWSYKHDENGNVYTIHDDNGNVTIEYDQGDAPFSFNDTLLQFDESGPINQHGQKVFHYDSENRLAFATVKDKYKKWYYYDYLGRLVGWFDGTDTCLFFYGNPNKQFLLTHVYHPEQNESFQFLYDHSDHLLAMTTKRTGVQDSMAYIMPDHLGSPIAVFDVEGNLVKEIERSPFGEVVEDSNPEFSLHIDFLGGIRDPTTGLIFIKSQVYDPQIQHWLNPNWMDMVKRLKNPEGVYMYRMNNNDPVSGAIDWNDMSDFSSWAKMYRLDADKIVGSSYVEANPLNVNSGLFPVVKPHLPIISGLSCKAEVNRREFLKYDLTQPSFLQYEPHKIPLISHISSRATTWGAGIMVMREVVRVMVVAVPQADSRVVQVLGSVLNGSLIMDFHFNIDDLDHFFLVKESQINFKKDYNDLQALGDSFNVTATDTNEGKELHLLNSDVVLTLHYGINFEDVKARILKRVRTAAIEDAWINEKSNVERGVLGLTNWSPEEQLELLSTNRVTGYKAKDIFSTARYPFLANDPLNIKFVRDGGDRKKRNRRRQKRRFRKRERKRFSFIGIG